MTESRDARGLGLYVGIGTDKFKKSKHLGADKNSWGFVLRSLKKVTNGKEKTHGNNEMDDVVNTIYKITVDTKEGTVAFGMDDEDFGEAYKSKAIKKGPVYAGVSIDDLGDTCVIVPGN